MEQLSHWAIEPLSDKKWKKKVNAEFERIQFWGQWNHGTDD